MCPVTVRDGARVPRKALDARTPYPPPEATFRIPAEGEKKKSPPVPFFPVQEAQPRTGKKAGGMSLIGGNRISPAESPMVSSRSIQKDDKLRKSPDFSCF